MAAGHRKAAIESDKMTGEIVFIETIMMGDDYKIIVAVRKIIHCRHTGRTITAVLADERLYQLFLRIPIGERLFLRLACCEEADRDSCHQRKYRFSHIVFV